MKRINGNIFKRAVSLLLLFSLVVVFAFVLINDTSAAETTLGLKVNATSNYFPTAYTTVDGGEEYVTVTYFINSPKDVLNVQWTLTYDPDYLEFAEADNMNAANRSNLMPMVDDLVWNADSKNYIKANASALELYKFAGKGLVPFATVTFKVIGSGETTVDLNVEVLTLSLPDSETQLTDSGQEEIVINNGVVDEAKVQTGRETSVYAGLYNPDYNAKVSNEEDIISALNNGVYKIKLTQDITLSGTLDLSDKIITLDLNGHILTGNIKLADNSETAKSTLYLIDSSTASDGVLDGKIDLTGSYLYANGGRVTGQVSMNDSASKIFCTSNTPTVFNGNVGNFGEIHGGIFYGDINKSCIKKKYITFMNGEDTYAYEVVSSDNNTVAPAEPDQAKYGYQNFDGWYNGEDVYSFGSALSEDIILKAKFSNPETFNITYDLDGGTATNPTSYNVESDTITLNNPTKAGYTFTGWSGTDLTGDDNVTVTIPKGSMGIRSYTAHFSPNSYTVSFDTAGGSTIGNKTGIMWSDKVLDGVTAPTKDGWEFTGWKYADTSVKADTKYSDLVTDDKITGITLVAQWKDINAPTGEISIGTKKWTELRDDITFSLFFKDTQEVTITAGDMSGEAVTIEYLLSNRVLTDSELGMETFIGYTGSFSINPDNKYVIYAKLTDASSNVTYISSQGIVLDSVAPVISGIENGKTYCEPQRVIVTEDYIKSVTVNDTEVTLNENNQFTLNPAEGKQTIVVTDEAGNVSAEMIVTVNNGHTDVNKDHACDYGCSVAIGEHTDANKDHACDYGCTEKIGEHTDTNKDHVCDYGCSVAIGEHKDANKDHVCDYGCSVPIGEHTGGEATCTELAICDICGEPYGELDSSNHNLEKISAKEATATEKGNIEYWHCLDCSKCFSDKDGKNSIELNDTVLQKLPPEIIDGTGQSVTQGDKKALIFRSNAAFVDFIRVEIDGNTLDENNYTINEGSTIVTLNAEYTATLSVGEHTIGIVSESGTAATTFTVNVKNTEDNDTTSPGTGDNNTNSSNAGDNNTNSSNAEDNNTNSPEVEENHIKSPSTGDNHRVVVWFVLMLVGGCLLIVTALNGISIERRKH